MIFSFNLVRGIQHGEEYITQYPNTLIAGNIKNDLVFYSHQPFANQPRKEPRRFSVVHSPIVSDSFVRPFLEG